MTPYDQPRSGGLVPFLRHWKHMPGNSVTVFTRRKIGYDHLAVEPYFCIAVLMLLGPHLLPAALWIAEWFLPVLAFLPVRAPSFDNSLTLMAYALALVPAVLYRRWEYRQTLRRGVLWDSRCRGVSHLEWMAQRFQHIRLNVVYSVIEPLLIGLAGLLVAHYLSTVLGVWLVLAGLSLAASEAERDRAEMGGLLALVNGELEARHRVFLQSVMTGNAALTGLQSIAASGGLSTGVTLEIAGPLVELIKAEPVPRVPATFIASRQPPDLLSV